MLLDELFSLEWCPVGGSQPQFRELWQKRAGVMQRQLLAHSQVFNISNVAEYLYKDVGEDSWDLQKDFPRPMPPFQNLWAEWKFPSEGRRERGSEVGPLWIRQFLAERMGCLIWTEENNGQYKSAGAEIPEAKWIVRFSPFMRPTGKNMIGVCPETRSTTELTVQEFSTYCERCIGLAGELGISIPAPGAVEI
jgi:hypothetical protein